MSTNLEVVDRLTETDVTGVVSLIQRVTDVDEVRPISEHVWLHIRHGGDSADSHILIREHGNVVGYAHLDSTDPVDGPSAELAVDPDHRQRGLGRALVTALTELSGDGRLRLWSHGELAASGKLAESMGFEQARVLWQMRRSLFAPLEKLELPDGVTIRAFEPGKDDDAWLELNAKAFADLPDQGLWTHVDLERRIAEPWFDRNGFLIAERDGRMIGFHWTKIHGHTTDRHANIEHRHGHDHEAIGEVYVVGIDPALRGLGIGRMMTLAGLHYLRSLGLAQVMLYVDEANTSAIRLYEDLGFSRWDTDVMYRR